MSFSYTYYQLDANSPLNACSSLKSRTGALFRVTSEDGNEGYGDCHPWPELGDLPIEEQIARLKSGQPTPLVNRALSFAQLDAAARSKGVHLLERNRSPDCHFLISDLLNCSSVHIQKIIEEGFTHVKVKMGRALAEADKLIELFSQSSLKIRLDFNETLNLAQFTQFLDQIASLKHHVDFIEDPLPFQIELWSLFQQQGWTLACDRQVVSAWGQPDAAAVLIIKPALHGPELYLKDTLQRKVVTTNVGHPIEQVAAAYAASVIDPGCLDKHGLLSHRVYHANDFSSQLNWCGPQFTFPYGTGCGFDDKLAALSWQEV